MSLGFQLLKDYDLAGEFKLIPILIKSFIAQRSRNSSLYTTTPCNMKVYRVIYKQDSR